MKKSKFILSLILGAIFISSCSKSNDENSTQTSTSYEYLDATSYTEWVYFSFMDKKIMTVKNPEKDLSWDIAFHRGDIRLNGGKSGIGQGKAVNTNTKDWNIEVKSPSTGFETDEIGEITIEFTGSNIVTDKQAFSQTLGTWITIDTNNPPPVYTYNNWVYIVKTADGKDVKLQIYDYKDAKNQKGAFISFRYDFI